MKLSLLPLAFIFSLMGSVQQSGDPPPLSYSHFSADEESYDVIDFHSGIVLTIPRIEEAFTPDPGQSYDFFPQEFEFQSPYDESLQFVLVDESDPTTVNVEGGYTLYQIFPDSIRHLITTNVLRPGLFSPDGHYLYIYANPAENLTATLFRYDFANQIIVRVINRILPPSQCDSTKEWCVLIRRTSSHDQMWYELYLLNRNHGTLILVDEFDSAGIHIWWENNVPEFTYGIGTAEGEYTIRTYNYENEHRVSIALISAFGLYTALWSPDHRWLAVEVTMRDDQQRTGIFIIDSSLENPTPVLISADFETVITPSLLGFEWVGTSFVFDAALGDEFGIYVAESPFPGGEIRTLAQFSRDDNMFDSAWSPDYQWLALSIQHRTPPYANAVYIVPFDGHEPLRQILLDEPPTDPYCIGWYEYEVYASGEALLC